MTPMTTWHTQTGLLVISWTWGLSYLTPPGDRIAFSEVFPPELQGPTSMRLWGGAMVILATLALVAERRINSSDGTHPVAWRLAWTAHAGLAGVYMTLALGALVSGWAELATTYPQWGGWRELYGCITAASRPALWAYIGYLHITFANLRRPDMQTPGSNTGPIEEPA
jgi:hypothetical protein